MLIVIYLFTYLFIYFVFCTNLENKLTQIPDSRSQDLTLKTIDAFSLNDSTFK